tara:strand:+ start:415 stop:660 length:246 start_codon:yes stop_codon:yes gene_type:complete
MKDEKIIVRIPRNATSELVVRTAEYWNIPIVDLRWYADGKPSRKGIRMNMDELQHLSKAINKIIEINKVNKNDVNEVSENV